MSEQGWFSSKVRLVVLAEGSGAIRYADSVYLFRAADYDAALQRALVLGRGQEQDYVGGEGQRIRWRLKEVVSLDAIEAEDLDGVELYSEPAALPAGETYGFDAAFTPETSKPTQTI